MKKANHCLCALTLLTIAAVQNAASQTNNQAEPTGDLSATPNVLRVGTYPTLTWQIFYPKTITDIIIITPPGIVTPNKNVTCDVSVLGLGVNNGINSYAKVRTKMKFNGSSTWTVLYEGYQTDATVMQQKKIGTFAIQANKTIEFGGEYYSAPKKKWQPFYTTQNTNPYQVRTLKNGDLCPSNVPAYNGTSLEAYLRPYLDASNRVRIGPMDLIVFMELTHTDTADPYFDLQDAVLLLTFK